MPNQDDIHPEEEGRVSPAMTRRQAVKWGALGTVGLAAVGTGCAQRG